MVCLECGNPVSRGKFCNPECYKTFRKANSSQVYREDRQQAEDLEKELEYRRICSQNKRLLRQIRTADRIVDQAASHLALLPVVQPPEKKPDDSAKIQEEALLLFTDHHIGAKFGWDEMGGLNKYDIDEYSKRLKYCVRKTIRLAKRQDVHVRKITVFAGGDMVDGLIHDSLERNADVPPVDQVVVGAHLLAQAIGELAGEFEEVHVACAPGNHGRIRKPHEMEAVTQNFDTLIYVLARAMLAGQENVTWSIPREFWNHVVVAGHGVLLLHGHVGIKGFSGMATYPGYGLRRSVDNLQGILRRVDKPVRYICMGHYHSYFCTSHEDGLLVINGSMVGVTPYGIASGFPYRPAVQVLMMFHEKYGMVGQHLLMPENHGVEAGYQWQRDKF